MSLDFLILSYPCATTPPLNHHLQCNAVVSSVVASVVQCGPTLPARPHKTHHTTSCNLMRSGGGAAWCHTSLCASPPQCRGIMAQIKALIHVLEALPKCNLIILKFESNLTWFASLATKTNQTRAAPAAGTGKLRFGQQICRGHAWCSQTTNS